MVRKYLESARIFRESLSDEERKILQELRKGQSPETMLITCSDSRIVPGKIFGHYFGEIFVFRNMGNLIPPYEEELESPAGVGAFLEYGVEKLGAKDLIVLGHTECGAVKGFLAPPGNEESFVGKYLKKGEELHRIIQNRVEDPASERGISEGVRTHTLLQAERAKKYPVIGALGISVHAWVYHIDTGEIEILL